VAWDSGRAAAVLPHTYGGPLPVLQTATLYGRAVVLLGNRTDDVTRYAVALDGQVAGALEPRVGHALRPLLAALAAPAPAPAPGGVLAALGGFLAAVGTALGQVPAALTDLLTHKATDLLAGLLGSAALAHLGDAVGAILRDPGAFLRNLGTAFQAAFTALLTHLHLGEDLVSWLTGALGGAIPLPRLSFADLGPAALTALIPTAQAVLGLDEAHLLDRIAAAYARRRHLPLERARAEVVAAESRLGQLATLAQDTWAGLERDPRQLVSELFDRLRGVVETALVQAALTKVAELAAPLVGEIIAAVQAVSSLVQTILDNAGALKAAFGVIVGQRARLAEGRDDALAASIGTDFIGPQFIKLIPGALTFLARFLQLEGIRTQLQALVAKVEGSIKGPLDHIVNAVVDRLVEARGHKATAAPAHPTPAHGGASTPAHDALHAVLTAAVTAVNDRVAAHPETPLSEEVVRGLLTEVAARHEGLDHLQLEPVAEKGYWAIRGSLEVPEAATTSPPHPHASGPDAAGAPLAAGAEARDGRALELDGAGAVSEGVRPPGHGRQAGSPHRTVTETDPTKARVGAVPYTQVTHQPDGEKAGTVTALPLTLTAPPGMRGAHHRPQEAPLGWTDVLAFDDIKVTPKTDSWQPAHWVKVHLLSDWLHGPGKRWNLVPGHKRDNGKMESGPEQRAKDALLTEGITALYYQAHVIYRGPSSYHGSDPAPVDWTNFPKEIHVTVATAKPKDDGSGEWEKDRDLSGSPFVLGDLIEPALNVERSTMVDLKTVSRTDLENIGVNTGLARQIDAEDRIAPFLDEADFIDRMTARYRTLDRSVDFMAKWWPVIQKVIDEKKATF